MSRCEQLRKVRHAHESLAIAHAIRLQRRGNDAGHRPLNVFRCAVCGDWHVGHRPKVTAAIAVTTARPAREAVVARDVPVGPVCACAPCKKRAQAMVMTPHGAVDVCQNHQRRLTAVYRDLQPDDRREIPSV